MEKTPESRIRQHLETLYGKDQAVKTRKRLENILTDFERRNASLLEDLQTNPGLINDADAFLITYGDQFRQPDLSPLGTLCDFLEAHLKDIINGVHILPFFPYSSDDGFSVIDYRSVDPDLGSWDDIARLKREFRLMFDAVINHISRGSEWFQAFLRGEEPYRGYFITVDPHLDLSMVVRPRALPLRTPVETSWGTKFVWTTFSDDQVDLNYANPAVLLEIVDLLLFYVERSARIIRLDAIAYLWKEIGTTCIHLPQTHLVVKLLRAVLDAVAPGVILITETNVPHTENISYFGEPLDEFNTAVQFQRGDEAQMVYQFPLAPLVLHTFISADARLLTDWVASLDVPYPGATFFNFIASHDGIGVRPAEGLLTNDELQALVARTIDHGGEVSYRTNRDGSQSVYELNITLYDALNNPHAPDVEFDVRRFLASQVIMLSLAGVPGIYVHSLFGSRNCYDCYKNTGRKRSINREKFVREELESKLDDPTTIASRVFNGYAHILRVRRQQAAFHPLGGQRILQLAKPVFALLRNSLDGTESILCLVNVSAQPLLLDIHPLDLNLPAAQTWQDLISGTDYQVKEGHLTFRLAGYQAMWLKPV